MAGEWHWAVCDVCRLLAGDLSAKLCFYCPKCDAEICQGHANDWVARARAAALRWAEKMSA